MADSITEDLKATEQAATTAADPAKVNPYDYNSRISEINNMYDSYANAQKTNLEAAYNQNLSNLEANRTKIAQQYQQQRNANAVNFERTRRNFNQQAMMNGINTGAGSQANLALGNQYQQSAASIGAAEAGANTELERSIADLKVKYEADVNEAIAKNDYNRAAALLDEYNNAYSQAMTKAQALAQYGDFSGYSELYGADAARQMSATWEIQNPLLAYNLGRISAARYKQITGANPPGFKSGGRRGNGGSYRNGSGTDEGDETGLGEEDYDSVIGFTGTPGGGGESGGGFGGNASSNTPRGTPTTHAAGSSPSLAAIRNNSNNTNTQNTNVSGLRNFLINNPYAGVSG